MLVERTKDLHLTDSDTLLEEDKHPLDKDFDALESSVAEAMEFWILAMCVTMKIY